MSKNVQVDVVISTLTNGNYMLRIEGASDITQVDLTPVEFAKAVTGTLAKDASQTEVIMSCMTNGDFMIRIEDQSSTKEFHLAPADFAKAVAGKSVKGCLI